MLNLLFYFSLVCFNFLDNLDVIVLRIYTRSFLSTCPLKLSFDKYIGGETLYYLEHTHGRAIQVRFVRRLKQRSAAISPLSCFALILYKRWPLETLSVDCKHVIDMIPCSRFMRVKHDQNSPAFEASSP